MTNIATKESKLISALESGQTLTAAQIAARFGVANPTATITNLREKGYSIYTNQRNGKSVYRLGKPTRRVVAAGYAALGASGAGMV